MDNLNEKRQHGSNTTSKGRAIKKEETTNDSHKINKGPDAEKVQGYDEDGRCNTSKGSDQSSNKNDED